MIAQYIFDEGLQIPGNIATALLYGIRIDTAGLSRGMSNLDLDMFYKLFNLADRKKIAELDNSTLRQTDLLAYSSAINSIKTYGKTSYANTGYNSPEPLIAAISDFIMMLDTTDNTVVYSVKDDGIKISVRSVGTINAGRLPIRHLRASEAAADTKIWPVVSFLMINVLQTLSTTINIFPS